MADGGPDRNQTALSAARAVSAARQVGAWFTANGGQFGPLVDVVGVLVIGWLIYSGKLTVLGGMPWLGLIYSNRRPPGTVAGSGALGVLWALPKLALKAKTGLWG